MDDEASNTYNDLENTCLAAILPSLVFPTTAGFEHFDGHNAEGQWKFTVIDSTDTDGGEVKELSLVLIRKEGFISFPTKTR